MGAGEEASTGRVGVVPAGRSDRDQGAGGRPLALVTGGQRGIGFAIGRAFARAGHDVVVADLTDGFDGAALAREWGVAGESRAGGDGATVHAFEADVGDEASVDELFGSIAEHAGRAPDVLVNNAAVQFWAPLLELSLDDWEQTLRVNLTGAFLTTRRFARARIEAGGGGSIVNLGSGCNRLAFPRLVSYTASKGGLEMLTKVSALELGEHGIRVNCIAPGSIETERTRAETVGYAERWSPLTPLGRVGTVEDVADAVIALSGAGMRFVSGETVAVDGGLFSRAAWPGEY